MDINQLHSNIVTALNSLNDTQIVELDAGRIGLTAFENGGRIVVTEGLTQDTWHDTALRNHFENIYGSGRYLSVYSVSDEDVYELACTDFEAGEAPLDKMLEDQAWVSAYAVKSRASMIAFARQSAEELIDRLSSEDVGA
jgi:hypothetical protein